MVYYKNVRDVYIDAFGMSKRDAEKLIWCMINISKYNRLRVKKKYANKGCKILKKYGAPLN